MSKTKENGIPDRIKSLIIDKYLENSIDTYKREEIANFTPKVINGIGPFYAARLKRRGNINTISELANINHTTALELGISQKLLEKWIISASIISKYATSNDLPISTRRICVSGLEQAGKSSLIKTLQKQEPSPVNFPTMGVSVESLHFLGLRIAIWDLGGQISFRDQYLIDPKQYFSRTLLLLYVIDIQKEDRFKETVEYLNDLLIKFNYLKEKPAIHIVLHKCDPNLDQTSLKNSIDVIFNEITPVLMKHNFKKFKVLKTSIFNVDMLVKDFSRIFANISPVSEILSDSLAFYSESYGLVGSFLISDHGFIAAEWTTPLTGEQRDILYFEIMELIRKEVYEVENKGEKFAVRSQLSGIVINIDRIEFDSIKLFLCSINPELRSINNRKIAELHETIRPWIINFFSIIKNS